MNATNPKVTPQHQNVKQASTMCPTNDWTSGGDCAEGVFSITIEVCCCCCCWEAGVNGCISSGWPASTVTTLGFITSCCQLTENKLHITPTFSYNWNQPKRWIVTNQKLPRMQSRITDFTPHVTLFASTAKLHCVWRGLWLLAADVIWQEATLSVEELKHWSCALLCCLLLTDISQLYKPHHTPHTPHYVKTWHHPQTESTLHTALSTVSVNTAKAMQFY